MIMLHYICIQELSSFFFYVMLFHIILSIKCSCHCWWKQLKWSILYRARISDLTNVFLQMSSYTPFTVLERWIHQIWTQKQKSIFEDFFQYIAFVLLLYFVNGYSGLENSEKNNMTLASKVVYLISARFNSLFWYYFVVLL